MASQGVHNVNSARRLHTVRVSNQDGRVFPHSNLSGRQHTSACRRMQLCACNALMHRTSAAALHAVILSAAAPHPVILNAPALDAVILSPLFGRRICILLLLGNWPALVPKTGNADWKCRSFGPPKNAGPLQKHGAQVLYIQRIDFFGLAPCFSPLGAAGTAVNAQDDRGVTLIGLRSCPRPEIQTGNTDPSPRQRTPGLQDDSGVRLPW